MIDAARVFAARLEESPFACRLAFEAGDVRADVATASVPYRAALANAQGFVHGGVAASLSVWSACLVALASDRDAAVVARPVSASVSYLAAAREEDLHATARLATRGRDLVHCEVEVDSGRGRRIAAALVVATTSPAPRRVHHHAPPAAAVQAAADAAPRGRILVSPFAREMGLDVSSLGAGPATVHAPCEPNRGADGAFDAGALLALADTCAALACMPSLDERLRGSATMSLSAVFGDAPSGPAVALGREVAESGGLRSALVEVFPDRGGHGGDHVRERAALTACVSYRFAAAEVGA